MRCVDVNVLVNAYDIRAPNHDAFRSWLEEALIGGERLGVSELVLSGFVRIVTNPKIHVVPTSIDLALSFAATVLEAPAATPIRPGARHWAIFDGLCRATGARGNVVPDAYHAALAIEHNATWVTADRGFSRFPGLRWEHPLDA